MAKREVKSIRVDPDVWKEAKAQAALGEKTLGEFVEMTLREKISERDKNSLNERSR